MLKMASSNFEEMHNYYKYKKLPAKRFKNSTNASLYIFRFKEGIFKKLVQNIFWLTPQKSSLFYSTKKKYYTWPKIIFKNYEFFIKNIINNCYIFLE